MRVPWGKRGESAGVEALSGTSCKTDFSPSTTSYFPCRHVEMSCLQCNDLIYVPRTVGDNVRRVHQVLPAALSSSADSGCTSYRFIFNSIRSVLGLHGFGRVEIEHFAARKDGEERQTYPLVVRAFVGQENIVEINLYTDNRECCRATAQ